MEQQKLLASDLRFLCFVLGVIIDVYDIINVMQNHQWSTYNQSNKIRCSA